MASGPMAEAVEHSTQHWKDENLTAVAVYFKSLGDEQQSSPKPLAAEDATMRTGAHLRKPVPAMPSFAWNMSDQHIADVLTFVRNSWGNAADAVSADEVKALRDDMQP